MNKEEIEKIIYEIVGDATVAEQITAALEYKADAKEYTKLCTEIEVLQSEVERLKSLVGDISVAEQISVALIG